MPFAFGKTSRRKRLFTSEFEAAWCRLELKIFWQLRITRQHGFWKGVLRVVLKSLERMLARSSRGSNGYIYEYAMNIS